MEIWLSTVGLIVLGAVLTTLAVVGASHPVIHPAEQRVFRALNTLPGWLLYVLWLPMQLGNLVVGTLAGLAIAWAYRDIEMAVAVVLAMLLKLGAERLLRRKMEPWLGVRQRPGTSEPDAVLRGGDVPAEGMSFPSGHVILVAAIATVVYNDIPGATLFVPFVLVALVMIGRVYVGAHNPLDVVAGAGVGLLVGGFLDIFL